MDLALLQMGYVVEARLKGIMFQKCYRKSANNHLSPSLASDDNALDKRPTLSEAVLVSNTTLAY